MMADALRDEFGDIDRRVVDAALMACGGDVPAAAKMLRRQLSSGDGAELTPMKLCIVCLDEPRATRFACGHACCCAECALAA